MNPLVVITVLVTVGAAEAKSFVNGTGATFHPVLSGFILGLFLFVFNLANSDLGQKLCYLVIAFALITNGSSVVKAFQPAIAKTSPTPSTGGGGGGGIAARPE